MMTKLTKVRKSGVRLSVEFSSINTILDGPHSLLFKSYVAFLGCSKVNMLLDDWKDVTYEVKNSIWTDVQKKFVKSRNSEEFMVKSEVGKLNKSKYKYPCRLSRGRYRKLEKTIIAKKRQQLGNGDSVNHDQGPSPPSRHEKWKRAR
ncbi:unnamed protein product [Lathyrus oleraceus]